MDEKTRLIQKLDVSRAKIKAALADIDQQTEIYPTWTIKHILAHIAGWDDAAIASLRAHAGGDKPATPATEGIDAYNEASVATREALSYDRIAREWELARDQFKDAIREMPPEKLAEPLLFPWGETGTVAQIVHIFAHHENGHAEEIRQLEARVE
ncbi:MAG: DinB family protein [Chloroflexi bacterium]|nr:DinB family protein [Chloroflexota bacterium]